ncbi:MAG TPA: Ger(x)C family spore germination protein [Desulfitobacteriaceae bacterium]|nr:Ger(x)C family spore germination protein [Desulfitobacteriaceae bacterium]
MNKFFRRSSFLVLLLVLVLPLSGCWSRREINQLGFVGSVAIDTVDDSDLLEVTAQLIRPEAITSGAGGGTAVGGGGSRERVWAVSAKGKTVSDAFSELNTISGDYLFFGQQTSIIIGEEAARRGVDELLDVFDRLPQLRRTIWVTVTPGRAKNILETNPKLTGIPSLTIESLFRYRHENSVAYPSNLNEVMLALSSRSSSPVAARLTTVSDEGEQDVNGSEIKLEGSGVFKGDQLIGWFNGLETRGLLWITEKFKHTILTIAQADELEEKQKYISFYMLTGKRKIHTELKDQKLLIQIKITCQANLIEQTGSRDMLSRELKLDQETISSLESAIASQIKEETRAVLMKAQQYQTDVFGIGERFYIEHPRQFKEIQEDWPELFANAELEISAAARVRRVGLINRSINAQIQEIPGL